MMESAALQRHLFAQVKKAIPAHLNMADELAALLNVSADSVYRRMRGEKEISLHELQVICSRFNLSLDALLQLQSSSVLFHASDLAKKDFSFTEILHNMQQQLAMMNSFSQKQMWYLCKDMPFWQFYLFDALGAFKTFFWAKTIHRDPALAGKKFSLGMDFSEQLQLGKACAALYQSIPSIELWNVESVNSTLSQVKFCIESGGFAHEDDIALVLDAFENTIDHLEQQAVKGFKFLPGDNRPMAELQFYVNEVVIGSNTIMATLDDKKIAFIPYNVFSFLHTMNDGFVDAVFRGMENLRTKSTLISVTGEKERNRFFEQLKTEVNLVRERKW